MKAIVIGVLVFAAGCGGHGLDSPLSPTSSSTTLARTGLPAGSAQTHARNGSAVPFRGSFTGQTIGKVNCPPTCPPTTLTITGTEEGTATHLGRFTADITEIVDLASATDAGTIEFTAANGDSVSATTVGKEVGFTPPNISTIEQVATIIGGTGRFDGVTGTFTVRFVQIIDFGEGTSTLSGSFEGHINLGY
jgi:hypothetical protein